MYARGHLLLRFFQQVIKQKEPTFLFHGKEKKGGGRGETSYHLILIFFLHLRKRTNDPTNIEPFFSLSLDMVRLAFTDVSMKNFEELFNLHRTAKVKPTVCYF